MKCVLAAVMMGLGTACAPSAGLAYHEGPVLSTTFDGSDGTFVSSAAFFRGRQDNPGWFADGGTMYRRAGTGHVATNGFFRMLTRRTDLAFTQTEMDIRFNRWVGGSEGWHGINLWLHRKLRSGRISDGPRQEGYVVDFLNRDGHLFIMKKVGGTYRILSKSRWRPQAGRWYRWGGRVINNGSTNTIQILLDGEVIQHATDNGSIGGPRLLGGRVGLRGDYASFNVDNLRISPAG